MLKLGTPTYALELWFAQTLRDAIAFSHAGGYQPLKEVLAALSRTLKLLGIEADAIQLSRVVNSFTELKLQPSAVEFFRILAEAAWKVEARRYAARLRNFQAQKRQLYQDCTEAITVQACKHRRFNLGTY